LRWRVFFDTLPRRRPSTIRRWQAFKLTVATEGDILMAFCSTCGAQIADGTTTCAACAGRAAAGGPAVATANAGGMADNVAGMLAYFTIIPAIIFIVMEPYNRNRFIRFHAFQCLFFAVAWTVLWIALSIVAHIPILGWLTILIWPLVGLAGLVIWIILVIKANQGQMYKLPVIGDMAEKQANAM
jgi:uncharacterized membrane protein